MNNKDIVVVFTDGFQRSFSALTVNIYDVDESETKQLLDDVAGKATTAVFLTTGREHDIDRWVNIKVEMENNQ